MAEKKQKTPPIICGAKTRSGKPCPNPPMTGKTRCKMHGGKSTGAKTAAGKLKAALSNFKHGFYAAAIHPDDIAIYNAAASEIGTLDEELKLARTRLFRLVKLSGDSDFAALVDSTGDVIQQTGTHPKFGKFTRTELKAALPNYGDLIAVALREIRNLEQARAVIAESAERLEQMREGRDQGNGKAVSGVEFRVVLPGEVVRAESDEGGDEEGDGDDGGADGH